MTRPPRRAFRSSGADHGLPLLAESFRTRPDWGSMEAKRDGLVALDRLHRQYRAFELHGDFGGNPRELGDLWNALVPSFFLTYPHDEVEADELFAIPDEHLSESFELLREKNAAFVANLPRIIRELRAQEEAPA